MSTVLTPEHALRLAQARVQERIEWEKELRETLLSFFERGVKLEPFDAGSVSMAVRKVLLDVEAEMGDVRAINRRNFKNISGRRKLAVIRRDDFTCQECGWQQTIEQVQEASRLARETGSNRVNRFLTVDHILPASEGGTSRDDNLRTLCSTCNGAKGKRLPLGTA
jgi:hypothetical protein